MFRTIIVFFVSCIPMLAIGSTTIDGTRVVFKESDKEAIVKVNNIGATPVVLQGWIDKGNAKIDPTNEKVPFIISPPINRINAGKSQTFRIRYTGGASSDKESLFWMNVLEIPAQIEDKMPTNFLQIAFRSRLKLFFRPKNLKGEPVLATKNAKWSISNGILHVSNNAPYYINLLGVKKNSGRTYETEMIPPFYSGVVPTPGNGISTFQSKEKFSFDYINDWGAVVNVKATVE
ncbi:molecular chaperone [Serratia plymuthica]|uniref:fimbrial biogenesis chaperone n=1 Tax=Serratia plymuthica TaxID=82996 RepID=UPI003DA67EBF